MKVARGSLVAIKKEMNGSVYALEVQLALAWQMFLKTKCPIMKQCFGT